MRMTHRLLCLPLALLVALNLLMLPAAPAFAQFFDESLEQEDLFAEDENVFFEDREGDGFGVPSPDQDFTESGRFVDETLVPADRGAVTRGARQRQLTLGRDRESLAPNMAWGAGTGLLIGGWFALISEGDNRETQRSIGLGIVTGILLGVAIGTRSVFNPDAPRPVTATPPPSSDGPRFSPLVATDAKGAQVGFRMTF
jgi:hypothetical protein